jgi:multidrug efflux system membrane fusion protein
LNLNAIGIVDEFAYFLFVRGPHDFMDKQDHPSAAASTGTPPKAGSPKSARRWPWILAGVILILAAIFWYTHHKAADQAAAGKNAANQPLMISTVKAQEGDIGVYVTALGVVTPLNMVSVKSRVDGQIMKVNYQEGQLVHAGDSLVEIDPGPYQAAVTQAQGQLARDNALLEDARLDLARYTEAYASNAIPKQQYDTQVATVHQYEGTVQLDQGNLDNAKVQLAYSRITAPITGRVGLRLVDAGNIVHASDTSPLVIITQLQPITVIFNVSEDYLPQIQAPLRAGDELSVDAFDRAMQRKLASGKLETLDNEIDPTTGTLKLRAIFTNADESLFPNQFVNVRLLVDTHEDVTLLANTAIQRNSDGAFVYLLNPDQTVSLHPVTNVVTDGNISEVENLDPGAVVAGDNFNRLTDGAKVTIRQAGEKGKGHQKSSS